MEEEKKDSIRFKEFSKQQTQETSTGLDARP